MGSGRRVDVMEGYEKADKVIEIFESMADTDERYPMWIETDVDVPRVTLALDEIPETKIGIAVSKLVVDGERVVVNRDFESLGRYVGTDEYYPEVEVMGFEHAVEMGENGVEMTVRADW